MNYSELLQLAKGWGNFVSERINIGHLRSIGYNSHGTSPIFCYTAKQTQSRKGITNVRTAGKVMPYHISPNGSAGGCLPAYAA